MKNAHNIVLVSVLKSRRDERLLIKGHWYRIPLTSLPKKKFKYIAFYKPAIFGKSGKRIEYYSKVIKKDLHKRIELLPREVLHPQANETYVKFTLDDVVRLNKPIKNIIPRRISFGFTTLSRLLGSKDILELYGVTPTEQIVRLALRKRGIKVVREHGVSYKGKRYRIDLALVCKNGKIAIECDNLKAHKTNSQIRKDIAKNRDLRLLGWKVVRLKEKDVLENLEWCIDKIVASVSVFESF
jgi:very-short-patch-repair endonuclease